MKILHLIIDHQVVERTMGIYEKVFPGCNEIIIFDAFNRSFRHIKQLNLSHVVRLGKGKKEGKQYDFSDDTHIVAHFLTMDMIDFIKCAPNNIHVCWEIYGWDLYNQFEKLLGIDIYYTDPKQYEKYNKYYYFEKYCSPLFNILLKLKGYKYRTEKEKKMQLDYISQRVDSIQACCKYDAVCLMQYANRKIPWYESFNYSLTETLGELKNTPFYDGKDILIGNSASLSNNHMYILNCIKDIEFNQDCKIIMPISYGGNTMYKNDIREAYTLKFGKKVEFITDYMPLHEYNKIFLRQKAMILSAWRQESIGTVIMGLYLGIKVFMSKKSPLYKWMNECGFIISTIESATGSDFEEKLSETDKQHNREKVLEKYAENVFAETLIKSFR